VATSDEVAALSLRSLRLYMVLLARYNSKREGWAWSLTALARDTRIRRDKVPQALAELESAGLLESTKGTPFAPTFYRLTLPASLRKEGGVVPNLGLPNLGLPEPGLPEPGLPNPGTRVVPNPGTRVVPKLGTTRQEIYKRGTRDDLRNPPSPPASRGELSEAAEAVGETGRPTFELPARMRGASLPPGSRMGVRAPTPATVPTSAPSELPPPETRAEAIRKLAGMMGIRPREARRAIERQEAIEAAPSAPPPLKVDASHLDELRALGWLTEEQERELMGRTA
jgi:hypothetical protein